jgi:peptide/nickel transport system substrate-binding protein
VSALAAALVLAAASTSDTLVIGLTADPVTLAPHRATDLVSAAVVANACDTLVRFRGKGHHAEAGLATTWATVDNRTWTFTLRQGVRFHDGVPFDAAAVVENVESFRRENGFSGRASRLGAHVVSIVLERPSAALLATLSQPFYSIVSPRALAKGELVGTGPFRLAGSQPGLVRLDANDDYWGGRPRLRHLAFRRFASEDALVAALRSGEADVTGAIRQDRIEAVRALQGLAFDSQTGLNIAFLSVNNERPPFDDVRVRQALARAIDRDALVESVLGGHGEPAKNPLPPSLWGYSSRTRELSLDRPASRRLLAEAGYPDGFDTTMLSVAAARLYMPDGERLAARLRDDLAQVGIRVRLQPVASWPEYTARGSRGDYDLMPIGWQADSTDPNDFLTSLVASETIGGTNRSRYRSPQMDAVLKRGRMAPDEDTRARVYREAQELFQRDMPWVPLYHVSTFTAHRSVVRDLAVGATGVLRYDRVWKAE